MTVQQALKEFYIKNNLTADGGEESDWFYMDFWLFKLKLPNPEFRKRVIHIHDIQHALYKQDISWRGEAFIAGWEMATGLWKYPPIGFMSVWAMGFSLCIYPKQVYKGFKEGWGNKGIIDLKKTKEVLLAMSIETLRGMIKKERLKILFPLSFLLWSLVSLATFLLPFIILLAIVI